MKTGYTFFIACFFLVKNFSMQAQVYKYLVMKGGGIRGIAYCGALKVLEEKGISSAIEKVGGTSVGAIVGAIYSVGYSADEIQHIMLGLEIKTFNDGEWSFIGGQDRMRKKYGWYKGEELEAWIGKVVKARTGSELTTFAQLHKMAAQDRRYKDLYVTVTNLTSQRLEIMSWETYPDLPIKTAVRASASIPLYYEAVFMDHNGHIRESPSDTGDYQIFVDGGLLANYPITMFNDATDVGSINKYTLGLKLERPEQISYNLTNTGQAPYKVDNFNSYLWALYNLTVEQLGASLPYAVESKNTIYISHSNMSPKVREISAKQKADLNENGKKAAEDFFKAR